MNLEEIRDEIKRLQVLEKEALKQAKEEQIQEMKKNIGLCAFSMETEKFYYVFDIPYNEDTGDVMINSKHYPCLEIDMSHYVPFTQVTKKIDWLKKREISRIEFLAAMETAIYDLQGLVYEK